MDWLFELKKATTLKLHAVKFTHKSKRWKSKF